ncbi:helix-turn-helix domain-containing protein [Streptomyces sp. NPDC048295]|uniref:helix-turn-helix domain-containing protein n=1 Tax=Streptomyces sp. NPDC048295 TaxID=3154617 RepID=UPI0034376D35
MAYGHKTPHQARIRAHIVLHAARGRSNARIARETGLHVETVRTWRGRFAEEGVAGLADRRRSGRPASFTSLQTTQVKALACHPPAQTGTPLARWSCPELAREGHGAGHHRLRVGFHRAPLAGPGCDQTLATPLVDLHHRPRLPTQSRAHP